MCPACQCGHKFNDSESPTERGCSWAFDGNEELPTFVGDLLIEGDDDRHRCHCAVTAGRIQFFSDCSHPFAGRTLDLPVWALPPSEGDSRG